MNKNRKRMVYLMEVMFVIISVIYIRGIMFPEYKEMYMGNWGFSLPKASECKEIYEKDTGSSFHGDGNRYHVYSYEEVEGIAEMVEWSKTEQNTRYFSSYREAAENWLTQIGVESESYPDYENVSYYYQRQEDNSELILIWNSEEEKIYVLESFM